MDNDSNIKNPFVWTWVAVTAAVLLITGALWWATATPDSRNQEKSTDTYIPPVGSGPESPQTPQMPNMPMAPPPPPNSDRSSAVVRVTPLEPDWTTSPRVHVTAKSSAKRGFRVPGMFPMGHIVSTKPMFHLEQTAPRLAELFPRFVYSDTTWSFSGSFARSRQVDLTSTGFDVEGRGVFSLVNAESPVSVLFMQSRLDPDLYAIYESGLGQ